MNSQVLASALASDWPWRRRMVRLGFGISRARACTGCGAGVFRGRRGDASVAGVVLASVAGAWRFQKKKSSSKSGKEKSSSLELLSASPPVSSEGGDESSDGGSSGSDG